MESKWVDINDVKLDIANKPRLLTEEEVERVLDYFPEVRCQDKDAKEVAEVSLRDSYRELLHYVYLDPSTVDEFGEEIARKFKNAMIVTGTSALATSDALAETVTQTTLSGFHASGSATSALTGIEGLKTLIFAYKPKNKVSIIHLKEPPKSFEEALGTRKFIEGLTISDLIDFKNVDIDNFETLGRPDWYTLYEVIHGPIDIIEDNRKKIDYNGTLMRVSLKRKTNVEELVAFLEDIAFGDNELPVVKIIYNPKKKNILDIHLIKDVVAEQDEAAFFDNFIIPTLNETVMGETDMTDILNLADAEVGLFKKLGKPSWYKDYEEVHGNIDFLWDITPYNAMIMRLPLKLNKLIYYDIPIDAIAGMIEDSSYGDYQAPCIKVIHSPISYATIDLHLKDGIIHKADPEIQRYAEIAFFRNAVCAVFDIMNIMGIPTAKKIYPVSLPVWDKSISLSRQLYESELKKAETTFPDVKPSNLWVAKLNNSSREKSGISIDEIVSLLDGLGIESNVEEDKIITYNKFSTEDISIFIRDRKNGLPYIKGSDIISVKIDKDISYANIRFLVLGKDFYIKYDPKYIKKVLYNMKKRGFTWSLKDSIKVWRKLEYNKNEKNFMEVLSTEEITIGEEERNRSTKVSIIQAYKLTKYPDWLTKELITRDPMEITNHLESFISEDKNRVFFLSREGNYYVHIPSKYKAEIDYYISKLGYKVNKATTFYYRMIDDPNIQIFRNQEANTEYLKLEHKYGKFITDLLDVKWGEKSNLRFTVHSEYKTIYSMNKADGGNEITLYRIEVTESDIAKLKAQLEDSKNNKFISYYIKKVDVTFTSKERMELDNLMAISLTTSFKANTAAQNYEHWYLTSKDKIDKKFTFYDTLAHPQIDSERTYVNNPNEITSVLGVEAAYTYFIKALKDLNDSSGNYIDPRHILLIADFIFSRGKPNGVLFAGLSRQPLGHITLITVERAMEVLRKLAFASNRENTNSVSAALATGQINPTGTGMYSTGNDPDIQKSISEYNKNIKNLNLSEDQIDEAMRNLNKSTLNPFEVPVTNMPKVTREYKVYIDSTLDELLLDVVKEAKIDKWLLESSGSVEKLKSPSFTIVKMKAADVTTKLLSGNITLDPPREERPKPKAKVEKPKVSLKPTTTRVRDSIAKEPAKGIEPTKGKEKEEEPAKGKEKEKEEEPAKGKEKEKEEEPTSRVPTSSLDLAPLDISNIGKSARPRSKGPVTMKDTSALRNRKK